MLQALIGLDLLGRGTGSNADTSYITHKSFVHCYVFTQALIWDMSALGAGEDVGLDPMLAYSAGAEINQLQWSSAHPDWVAICFANLCQILRV